MTIGEWATRLRYRYVPDHAVGEVLGRRWMDNAIPIVPLLALAIFLDESIPKFHRSWKSFRYLSSDPRLLRLHC